MDTIALEEIRRLKHRYLRSVDLKRWDDLAATLAPDAVADYGTPVYGKPLILRGRDAILDSMRENLGPGIVTMHSAGHHEIDVDGDTARGTWAFEDTVIVTEHRFLIRGAAYYEDRYARGEDGRWRIADTGYERAYESTQSLADTPSFRLTANRWAEPQHA